VDDQSAFWSLHPYVYGKTFPAIPFSRATATVATEWKNGNGTTERHNGTAMAKRQWHNGNRMVETRHYVEDIRRERNNHLSHIQIKNMIFIYAWTSLVWQQDSHLVHRNFCFKTPGDGG